jgi:hypothetical protein
MSGFLSNLLSSNPTSSNTPNLIGSLPPVIETISPTSGFNKNYMVYLHGRDETNAVVSVYASIPEQFNLHLQSDWGSLLSSPHLSGIVGALSQKGGNIATGVATASKDLIGITDVSPALTHLVWQSTSPINITIPFQFNAVEDEEIDVVNPMVTIAKLVLPSFTKHHLLRVPGPTILKPKSHGSPYNISLRLGTGIKMPDVIVTSVSLTMDSMFTKRGKIISAQADVSITTSRIYTKDDVDLMFGINPAKQKTKSLGSASQSKSLSTSSTSYTT